MLIPCEIFTAIGESELAIQRLCESAPVLLVEFLPDSPRLFSRHDRPAGVAKATAQLVDPLMVGGTGRRQATWVSCVRATLQLGLQEEVEGVEHGLQRLASINGALQLINVL